LNNLPRKALAAQIEEIFLRQCRADAKAFPARRKQHELKVFGRIDRDIDFLQIIAGRMREHRRFRARSERRRIWQAHRRNFFARSRQIFEFAGSQSIG